MHTDTPLAGHPTLALTIFGLALAVTGGRALIGLGRLAWRDTCPQEHSRPRWQR
ncbi:hypothetical protein [Ornithinimicrobium sufpigmenti]|uniref:hypothetical protein n=1 Tax=Ornithinimicrobium sufpigmenti TaxID=2508882 RepID=UPI0015E16E4A|nr:MULTISPECIES: hypothetical protein [unclassified Ornithinimicrobium]